MIFIFVTVPFEALEQVAEAMFAAGAGRIGEYDKCCFVTEGVGQFRPLENSRPYSGMQGQLNKVKEYKLETVCSEQNYQAVVKAMLESHPYEAPYWYKLSST